MCKAEVGNSGDSEREQKACIRDRNYDQCECRILVSFVPSPLCMISKLFRFLFRPTFLHLIVSLYISLACLLLKHPGSIMFNIRAFTNPVMVGACALRLWATFVRAVVWDKLGVDCRVSFHDMIWVGMVS